jgi:predicted cupin superfamily sugar epimerase
MTADEVIAALKLEPHPIEGGYFRETYRSSAYLPQSVLPWNAGPRSLSTAIYYLLTPQTVSAMHRLPTDEVFHFYLGDPVRMLQLWPDGKSQTLILGNAIDKGHLLQTVVPGGVWQGSFLLASGNFALLGATMAPGFDYADYQSGDRDELERVWPDEAELIKKLTPQIC